MPATVSVRIAHRAVPEALWQLGHDTRQNSQELKYIDHEKTAENSVIVKPVSPEILRLECEQLRAQRDVKRKMRDNAAVMTTGIITFSYEAQGIIESLPTEKQNAVFQDIAEEIAYGCDTKLTGLVVHRDEAAVHAHFEMRALNSLGVPLSKSLDRKATSQLQDIAGEVLQRHGLDVHRGERKWEKVQRLEAEGKTRQEAMSEVSHKSVGQLHREQVIDIAKKQERLQQLAIELQEQQARQEKNRRLIQEQEKKLEEGRVEEEKALQRIQTYERREQDAKAKAEALEKEEQDIRQRIEVSTVEEQTVQSRLDAAKAEEIAAQARLANLGTSEKEAQARVDALHKTIAEMEPREKALRKFLRENQEQIPFPKQHEVEIKTGLLKSEKRTVIYPDDAQDWLEDAKQWAMKTQMQTQQQEAEQLAKWKAELEEAQTERMRLDALVAKREKEQDERERAYGDHGRQLREYDMRTLKLARLFDIQSSHRGEVWGYIDRGSSLKGVWDAVHRDIAKGKIMAHGLGQDRGMSR